MDIPYIKYIIHYQKISYNLYLIKYYLFIMSKTPTGSRIMDKFLHGGYDNDIITTIYGPAGSGKTILCMLCSLNLARKGKKIIYVDTEGGYSIERLKQIAPDYLKILNNMLFLRPTSFEEQKRSFDKLRKIVNDKIGLIIVDTISMLYRLELGKSEDVYEINRELGKQISYLTEIARKKNIPVLLANQVYADFDNKSAIKMVGGDILKYGSKILIELQNLSGGIKRAILRKHRSLEVDREFWFKIVQGGILGVKRKMFGLF